MRDLPSKHRFAVIGGALLCLVGCAHARATAPSANVPVVHFRDDALGVSVDLPASGQFHTGQQRGVLAQSTDATEVRLFIEFPPEEATAATCWQQLYAHVPSDSPDGPKSAEELAVVGRQGLHRQGHVVYFSVLPHENRCYVVMVDGAEGSALPAAAEQAVERSVKVEEPSSAVASDFEIKAGAQALSAKEYDRALERFEKALQLTPDSLSAHFGAGLAAYLSGPGKAAAAVEYFKPVLESATQEQPAEGTTQVQPGELHDALMFTGLAYASLHQYGAAVDKLEEASDRYPDDGTVRYNLACVLALSGDGTGALGELREAFKREPSLAEHARQDDDLRSLRKSAEWKALLDLPSAPVPQSSR